MVTKPLDALRDLLEYVRHTSNLEGHLMGGIKNDVEILEDYLQTFELTQQN